MNNSSLPEAPQGIGDIIGLAFRMTRRNLSTIFRFILLPSLFMLAAGVLFQWVFTYGTATIAESKSFAAAASLFGFFVIAVALYAISWWWLQIRLLALVRYALGFSTSLDDSLKYMTRRRWAIIGLFALEVVMVGVVVVIISFIGGLAVAGGAVVGAASDLMRAVVMSTAGVLTILGILVAMTFYSLWFFISDAMLACENEPLMGILGRSMSMTFSHFWRALAFGFLFLITSTIISYPLNMPVAAFAFVDAFRHALSSATEGGGASYKPAMYLLVLTQAWEAAVGIILRPLFIFSFGLFYYDLRMRDEGLDIKRRLQALEAVQ